MKRPTSFLVWSKTARAGSHRKTMIPDAHFQAALRIWAERGERTCRPITGNCMAPLIREGDVLLIEHGDARFRLGDVLVLGAPDGFRVHRVVQVDRKGVRESLVVKSDQRSSPRIVVPRERVLGRVVEVRGSNGCLRFDSFFWRGFNALVALLSRFSGFPSSWAPGESILKKLVLPAYALSTRFQGNPIKEVGRDGTGETCPQGRGTGTTYGRRGGAL